jgi:catechol 2,3-dioxygenase-like lactoylglutathione lyase family enzyme
MGILQAAKPAVVICTRDRAAATAFYRDVLGIDLISEDDFAAVFDASGTPLRVSFVEGFVPHEHTMLGFKVADVPATVRALTDKGVSFKRLDHLTQDELGILTARALQVAWFTDPDGNILSITNV